MLESLSVFSDTLNKSITKFAEILERDSASRCMNQSVHVKTPKLESVAAVAAFADTVKESKAKIDEFLQHTTAPSGTCVNQNMEPSTLESMEAFASTLKDSMTKFDAYMEHISKSLDEYPDELRDLCGFNTQIGKHCHDQYQEHLKPMHSDITPLSICALSGEDVMSQTMHRGYATTSAVDAQANW